MSGAQDRYAAAIRGTSLASAAIAPGTTPAGTQRRMPSSTTLATSLQTFHRAAQAAPEELPPSWPRAKGEPRPAALKRGEGE
jgi:hypothetical protein